MGIIDYLRKYTWDKQIESYEKKINTCIRKYYNKSGKLQ